MSFRPPDRPVVSDSENAVHRDPILDGGDASSGRSPSEVQDRRDSFSNQLPLTGETVAFTGILASMVHKEAFRLVEQHGGRPTQSLSRSTTMLIVGEEGWPLEADGNASQKMIHASQMIADGESIRIISESDWLHLLGLQERRDEIHRAYTPAMLSRMLEVPVSMIRRWARLGLIRPVRRICRLPYFDYREVASARRLASLLSEGVSAEKIERSLGELSRNLSGTDRSLAQLTLLVQDRNVVLRDARGVLNPRTRQRLLDFDDVDESTTNRPAPTLTDRSEKHPDISSADDGQLRIAALTEPQKNGITCNADDVDDADDEPVSLSITEARLALGDRRMSEWNADEWFHEACRLAEESEFDSAVNAFRNAMSLLVSEQFLLRESEGYDRPGSSAAFRDRPCPDPADVNFHLADALYRSGKLDAAVERYRCAIEFAPDFIEAWTQLGCLLAESDQSELAEEALLTAISIHPGNPDALLHYAQLLDRVGRSEEALSWWEQYLQYDSRGPWADHARLRLEDQQAVP